MSGPGMDPRVKRLLPAPSIIVPPWAEKPVLVRIKSPVSTLASRKDKLFPSIRVRGEFPMIFMDEAFDTKQDVLWKRAATNGHSPLQVVALLIRIPLLSGMKGREDRHPYRGGMK